MTAATKATTSVTPDPAEVSLVDEGEMLRRRTSGLLQAMGITRVIWVDDQHAVDDGTSDLDKVQEGLFAPGVLEGIWGCLDVAELAIPTSIDRASAEETRELLATTWVDFPEDLRVQMTQVVRAATRADLDPALPDVQRTSELEAVPIGDLFDLDGVTFLPLSLAEWRAQSPALLDSDEPTLLLIDRDFSYEDGGITGGETLLAEVLSDPRGSNCAVAMFSHTVSSEQDERDLATDLVERHGLEPTRVTAIGKYRSSTSLPEALRVLLLATELEDYRSLIRGGLEAAHLAALNKIELLHRYTLLGAVAAAADEGAYELDMPTRIAMNVYVPVVEAALRDRELAPPLLERFRDTVTRNAYQFAGTENTQIRAAIREDIFEDARRLSELHLAIEVGDIFETRPTGPGATSLNPRYWVLLAQACDVSIRGNGSRANNVEALTLTQLRPEANPRVAARFLNAPRMHPVGQYDPEDERIWFINAAEQIVVPTVAIDATVFGPDGNAVLPCPEPRVPVSEGWCRRRDSLNKVALKWLADYSASTQLLQPPAPGTSPKQYQRTLAMIGNSIAGARPYLKHGVMVAIDANASTVEYGLRRAGRITEHKARYLLNLAVGYHGRPAEESTLVIERPSLR